jgi:hypothetical protein
MRPPPDPCPRRSAPQTWTTACTGANAASRRRCTKTSWVRAPRRARARCAAPGPSRDGGASRSCVADAPRRCACPRAAAAYMRERMNVPAEQVAELCQSTYFEHGTTMAGLVVRRPRRPHFPAIAGRGGSRAARRAAGPPPPARAAPPRAYARRSAGVRAPRRGGAPRRRARPGAHAPQAPARPRPAPSPHRARRRARPRATSSTWRSGTPGRTAACGTRSTWLRTQRCARCYCPSRCRATSSPTRTTRTRRRA